MAEGSPSVLRRFAGIGWDLVLSARSRSCSALFLFNWEGLRSSKLSSSVSLRALLSFVEVLAAWEEDRLSLSDSAIPLSRGSFLNFCRGTFSSTRLALCFGGKLDEGISLSVVRVGGGLLAGKSPERPFALVVFVARAALLPAGDSTGAILVLSGVSFGRTPLGLSST